MAKSPEAYARFLVYCRQWHKTIRERRKAAGVCSKCGSVPVSTYATCWTCRITDNGHRKRRTA